MTLLLSSSAVKVGAISLHGKYIILISFSLFAGWGEDEEN
jgi:hypothetical protein